METRSAALAMIKAFPGGWDSMAAALGMTRAALENRVYERKGQALSTHTQLQMQEFSETRHFAQAIAMISGGVFLQLPQAEELDNDELLTKFNAVYAEVGKLSSRFSEAIANDNEIDRHEKEDLKKIGDQIHRRIEELLRLTFSVFCK